MQGWWARAWAPAASCRSRASQHSRSAASPAGSPALNHRRSFTATLYASAIIYFYNSGLQGIALRRQWLRISPPSLLNLGLGAREGAGVMEQRGARAGGAEQGGQGIAAEEGFVSQRRVVILGRREESWKARSLLQSRRGAEHRFLLIPDPPPSSNSPQGGLNKKEQGGCWTHRHGNTA